MKFCKAYLLLSIVFLSSAVFAQVPDTLSFDVEQMEGYYEQEDTEVYEPSDEEKIIQDESDAAREAVIHTEDVIDYVQYLLGADSLVSHYAIYAGDEAITEYVGSSTSTDKLVEKFDVIEQQGDDAFFYCKEYIYNDNKAWDYIYERLYGNDGKLIYFVRQYNTYNSGCAEVAFERSEYYWSKTGELIRKTYEIYDSHNNPLEVQDCWMERESYDKIMDKDAFLSEHHFPSAVHGDEEPISE